MEKKINVQVSRRGKSRCNKFHEQKSARNKFQEQNRFHEFQKNQYARSFGNKNQHATSSMNKSTRNKFHEQKQFHEEKNQCTRAMKRKEHATCFTNKNWHASSFTNNNQHVTSSMNKISVTRRDNQCKCFTKRKINIEPDSWTKISMLQILRTKSRTPQAPWIKLVSRWEESIFKYYEGTNQHFSKPQSHGMPKISWKK